MLYPVISAPPVFVGEDQDNTIVGVLLPDVFRELTTSGVVLGFEFDTELLLKYNPFEVFIQK
jgi:alpha-acetolactate decarboxylase